MPKDLHIILASGSHARQAMLNNAGIQFDIDPADIDEAAIKRSAVSRRIAPSRIAVELATAKAKLVSARHPNAIVIGSDQILDVDGNLLSKVRDMHQAAEQIRNLEGRDHYLHSAAVCCRNGNIEFESVETALLTMWPLRPAEITAYLDEVGPAILGSVGCYHIEGRGVRLFRKLEGSHFTIMGMPLVPLLGHLRQFSPSPGNQPE